MLNFFLVLGLIPGTNFQITFNEIVLSVLVLVFSYVAVSSRRPKIIIKQEFVQLSRLHSFSFPIATNLPADPAPRVNRPKLFEPLAAAELDRIVLSAVLYSWHRLWLGKLRSILASTTHHLS
ncbi:MAG TPA: hypothetical protein VFT49_00135 [Candidatus Saccharimonadales bacterium]|nr:hypothetical protein [Candidatus Saccharimonadales bacterium]